MTNSHNVIDSQHRNYYDELFSPDTKSTNSSHLDLVYPSSDSIESQFVFSGLSMLENESTSAKEPEPSLSSSLSSFRIFRSTVENSSSVLSNSDMDISSSDSSSNVSMEDMEGENQSSICSASIESPAPVTSFLDEDEISDLLGENIRLPDEQTREVLEDDNIDIIASFNVRNKYDHATAAELLINEKITFLSIQEPYASSHKAAESWKAFQKLELQTARIACYETPYQMLLFDTWKWGGKVLTAFQSLQYGRVAAISFDLGKNLQIGIVSIYAPTRNHKTSETEDTSTHPSMKITSNLVQKILSKWKSLYPNMMTIILGDLQETVSGLNRDNLGNYRCEPSQDGVLSNLSHSHSSIVRDKNPDITYVTRFGKEGARGIDHILLPVEDKFRDLCVGATIKRDVGANYFPSDHSMISCSIRRAGQNNNCSGSVKTKFDYRKLFSIKLKQSGRLGKDLDFDTSQFKGCKKYVEQLKLFTEIQKRTGDSAARTKTHLADLETRTDALFQQLWNDGVSQKIDNESNDLLDITDFHAVELSYILKQFNNAVKLIMSDLKLADDTNANDSAGVTRGRLRKRKGFKLFNNLPVPTKLRFLKSSIETKLREVSKSIYWMDEFHIRSNHEDNTSHRLSPDIFWKQWQKILNDSMLRNNAAKVTKAYEEEGSERVLHVEAVQHEIRKQSLKKKTTPSHEAKEDTGNTLPHVPDNVTRLLNFWLGNSHCNQGFSTPSPAGGGSTAFLTQKISDWKNILLETDVEDFDINLPHQYKIIYSLLENSQNALHKLGIQITKLQTFYRQSTLEYFLDTNNISSFTNKVSFKSRQAPAAHTSIWDDSLMEFRTCLDEVEELKATSAFHGNWMANSKASETCAFAEVFSVGRLGYRGVRLKPNRVVTMQDVSKLIHRGDSLPRRIKKAFVRAHGPHTANLFREPEEDNSEFFYPFYLLDDKGTMSNEDKLEEGLWKSIATIPSKARFEGFQLAVVGRFAPRWRNLLLKIVKLILVMRYIPSTLKQMARFPIPKPGRPNEYRPISLCHDLYCYIMGVITSYSSAAIERAGILHEGITAYQKGKGCANLVTTELCFREDCLENCVPTVQIDEDEEKFFDRIPVEILLAAMRVNGFPAKGYVEIKASAMEAKTVEIITAKGITYARFVCGLEQGNPDSPTISNLVIKFKHDIWNFISKDIKLLLEKNSLDKEGYKFHSVDKKDGQVYLCKIGYSDDNSKYISLKNEEDLLYFVKYYTQLSGDISMVSKIGRKSSKCEVHFFNITADLAIRMQKVWSTAWSFVDDAPIEEQIPFKIHLNPEELHKFYILTDFFNLTEEKQEEWNAIIGAKAHKHLGLACTLGADTSSSWRKVIEKMHEKLTKLNVYKMHINAQRKCFNMLVSTIPTFAPVQMNFPSKELLQFDKQAALVCMKSNGLSKTDCKIRMFLPAKFGGLGLRSTMELDIISTAREFEIIGNSGNLDSRSFRTRISALDHYPLLSLFQNRNHARDAIAKLARYGIYVRNESDIEINDILDKLNLENKWYIPFNHIDYKDPCTMGIGLGKDRNLQLMYGGPVHSILKMLQSNNWKSSEAIIQAAQHFRIPIQKLIHLYSQGAGMTDEVYARFCSFREWRNKTFQQWHRIPSTEEYWELFSFKYPERDVTKSKHQTQIEFKSSCIQKSKLGWENQVRCDPRSDRLIFNTYSWEGKLLQFIIQSKSPVFVATDGSHSDAGEVTKTSSSFVLCVLDIRNNEKLASEEWIDRPVIPLLSRVSSLPQNFGTCSTDIAHGEFCAMLLAELALSDLPRVTISDSKAIREQMFKIKELSSKTNDRSYIRNVAGGIGKFISGTMREILFQSRKIRLEESNSKPKRICQEILEQRNSLFLNIAKQWTTPSAFNEDDEVIGWEEAYFDDEKRCPILKVNSHQLDHTGTKMKSPSRYKKLIPNLAMLNANHHADVCADYGKSFHGTPYYFNKPSTYLRFFFTCGGKHIDRNISDFCHEHFSALKVRKLKMKKTQGLIWRLLPDTTTTWEILNLHKGWLRSLLGLSSTHTRRVYKSDIYRECCKAKLVSINDQKGLFSNDTGSIKMKDTLDILGDCLWCKNTAGVKQKGNRNHAFLYCQHEDLSSFRRKITNLIESKFRIFFLDLYKATNLENINTCIEEIETIFLGFQEGNVNRLEKVQKAENNRYLSIQLILSRENMSNVQDLLKFSKCNFYCELFGLLPNLSGLPIRDEQIGSLDCPWLGLIPTPIDDTIVKRCNEINKHISHKESAEQISTYLHQSWKEIKNLIMGKAIGIHRIICSTGARLEKEWRKEFNIDINSIKKLKEESSPNSIKPRVVSPTDKGPRKRKYAICGGEPITLPSKRIRTIIIDNEDATLKRKCTGFTCIAKYKGWYPNSSFSQNQIKITIKQCQRCSRYMTVLKLCLTASNEIEAASENDIDTLIEFIQNNINNVKRNYVTFAKVFNKCLPVTSSIPSLVTQGKSKRISDRFKLLCNIFFIATTKATNNFTATDHNIIPRISSIFQKLLSSKESDFSLERKAETKIKLLISSKNNIPCKDATDLPPENKNDISITVQSKPKTRMPTTSSNPPRTCIFINTPSQDIKVQTASITKDTSSTTSNSLTGQKVSIKKERDPQLEIPLVTSLAQDEPKTSVNHKKDLHIIAATIIRPYRYMSGSIMMRAIEVLRSYKAQNVYFASAEASNQISSWKLTDGWPKFAKTFGNRILIDNKLNGVYFIPLFSGNTTEGHWSLCVIKKYSQRKISAWNIDSLGSGSINSTTHLKIATAFAPGRAKFTWKACHCRCQEEAECGPRTVLAMKIILEELIKNVSIEDCVKTATLTQSPQNSYTPSKIRETIAYFVNEYTPEMITPPIRLRTGQRRREPPAKNKGIIRENASETIEID